MTGPLANDTAARVAAYGSMRERKRGSLGLLPLLVLPPFIGRNTQPQRIEFDKSLGVFLVIRPIIRLEGGDRLIKQ